MDALHQIRFLVPETATGVLLPSTHADIPRAAAGLQLVAVGESGNPDQALRGLDVAVGSPIGEMTGSENAAYPSVYHHFCQIRKHVIFVSPLRRTILTLRNGDTFEEFGNHIVHADVGGFRLETKQDTMV